MGPMEVTKPTSHPKIPWLNLDTNANIHPMYVAKPASHPEMFWLNADAS